MFCVTIPLGSTFHLRVLVDVQVKLQTTLMESLVPGQTDPSRSEVHRAYSPEAQCYKLTELH